MSKLDFAAINAALDPETWVPKWLPDGARKGKEWVCRNPLRSDREAGSFTVNLKTGFWKDFAGDPVTDVGKDLISLYAYLFHDNEQGKAAKELAEHHNIRLTPQARAEALAARDKKVKDFEQSKPRLIMPVPATATKPDFKHWEYGQPSRVWAYRNDAGQVMLYVCRFDPEGGRKQVLPYSWCHDPVKNKDRWVWKGITGQDKRPLYGIDRLADDEEADVILVEGEKAADAGQEVMDPLGAVVVSWMGGVESADKVDVRPLAGRRVILFPDHDAQRQKLTKAEQEQGIDPDSKPLLPFHEQPGVRAMMALFLQLKGVAREVIMVGYSMDPENHGWDLADAQLDGWDGKRVLEYIGKNAGDPVFISAGNLPAPPAPPDEPPAGGGDDDDGADDDGAPSDRVPLDCTVNPFGFPHHSDKMQPLNTWENLNYLLGQYGITARYNIVKKSVDVKVPGRHYTMDNQANCSLAELSSLCARNRMPKSDLADYVKLIADRNAFNPVRDWIESKPWDGRSRIQDILETIQVAPENKEMRDMLVYRWLLSAVAAMYVPQGFESHGCLVFVGEQGQGKTKWVKRLVPAHLNVVQDGAVLDPADKDSVLRATAHWLVELGELDATFRKADIARLKSFITLQVDKVRRPYDRLESEYQRRTVFFASVNTEKYLVDDTGNRRWWTVLTVNVDYEHQVDVQQLWAELLTHHKRGERCYLTKEEQAKLQEVNQEHEATDPVKEQILRHFDWENEGVGTQEMTATEVLLAIGYDKPSKAQATHASGVLKELTGKEARRCGKGRFFSLPRTLRWDKSQPRPAPTGSDDPPY